MLFRSLVWSQDRRQGAIYLLFYVLPFALLTVALARLRHSATGMAAVWGQLTVMAVAFAALGLWQYATRNLFWNPKVIVDNAYATSSWFYRVNSVFYDPSIYGRFLVVAILCALVAVLFGSAPLAWAGLVAVVVVFAGLVPSFSQSSFVALAVGVAAALTALWRGRSLLPLAVALAALLVVSLAVPQARHRVLGQAGLSHATGGRSTLVANGIDLALHHPLLGVGTGGFVEGYKELTHLKGKRPKAAASHDTPVTVAAELGLPGLCLLAWLLWAAVGHAFRANPVRGPSGQIGRAHV